VFAIDRERKELQVHWGISFAVNFQLRLRRFVIAVGINDLQLLKRWDLGHINHVSQLDLTFADFNVAIVIDSEVSQWMPKRVSC
jgi:hypothetical protein